ncbi:50S ribosomal protein L18 [Zobellia roscoffensis]|uniref:50S ribosomal protein L18 n=1 Tax=Zobellia roscoffensis TaxID=2779508 RepID=UPI001889D38C|nr:50S ribosomal protein L18 [Zobellia roscoffensis]
MGLSTSERKQRIRRRIRKVSNGTAERPRLSVFRSNKEIYAQVIDDTKGATLAFVSSRDKDLAKEKGTKIEIASLVGKAIAAKCKEAGIEKVAFDRGGNLYHGRVKSLADGAREAGLNF